MKREKFNYRSAKWQAVRFEALRRNHLQNQSRGGLQCEKCSKTAFIDGMLYHVHHRTPVRVKPELAYDLNNLEVLCEDCHGKQHPRWHQTPIKISQPIREIRVQRPLPLDTPADLSPTFLDLSARWTARR